MRKLFYILGLALLFQSCLEEAEIWDSSTVKLAGQWWVRTYEPDGSLAEDYGNMLTYNTADDNGEMWVDFPGVVTFNGKSLVDTDGTTFAGSGKFPITNGQVFAGLGSSKTGVKTDSIYMQVSSGGVIYTVAGHKRTGFQEDQY